MEHLVTVSYAVILVIILASFIFGIIAGVRLASGGTGRYR